MTENQRPHSKRLPGVKGIEVPEEVAAAEGLPDDLDASLLGPYTVPSLTRRRRAGAYYLGGAVLLALGITSGLPAGMWIMVGVLIAIGLYHFVSAFDLAVADTEALRIANQATDFPVGHASAAVGFEGWRALFPKHIPTHNHDSRQRQHTAEQQPRRKGFAHNHDPDKSRDNWIEVEIS